MRTSIALLAAIGAALAQPVSVVDTIGGNTYDCSTICAGIQRMVWFDPDNGVHAAWWYSASDQTTFPDRNSRYNFRDAATGEWTWTNPDYMLSGINVFTERNGYGSMDFDPVRRVPVIATHLGAVIHPSVARDVATGSGAFEFCSGSPTLDYFLWPWCAVSDNGDVHLALTDDGTRNGLHHSRTTDWSTWSTPFDIPANEPDPSFPNHHITASKQSGKVAIVWEYSEGAPDPGFVRLSTDRGLTWQEPVDLGWPEAFGTDTLPSYHISSFGSLFDSEDKLHVVAAVEPFVAGMGYVAPVELWHWCAEQTPNWSRIHRAEPDTIPCSVGYNTLFACRPKLGQDPVTGRLYVAWSEFDETNIDSSLLRLRADIWAAASEDAGRNWLPGVRLTGPDQASRMYFDLAPIVNDTLHIVCQEDLEAGMFVQGEGVATRNPVTYRAVPAPLLGIAEGQPAPLPAEPLLGVSLARSAFRLLAPRAGRLRLTDACGRVLLDRHVKRDEAITYSPGAAGVYLARLTHRGGELVGRVTVVR